jgi:hypothetical protein
MAFTKVYAKILAGMLDEDAQIAKNNRDPELTRKAGFESKKSYRSFEGHWYVYGLADHRLMRELVFCAASGMCQTCPEPHFVPWDKGKWAHPKAFGGKRCDGPCCGKWSCHDGHERLHKRKF